MDDRTPVIVGVGQVLGAEGAEEPIDLVVAAAERALADCGAKGLSIELVADPIGWKVELTSDGARLADQGGGAGGGANCTTDEGASPEVTR